MTNRFVVAIGIALLGVVAVVYASTTRHGAAPSAIAAALPGAIPPPPGELAHAQVQNDVQKLQLIQAQVQLLTIQFQQTQAALQQKLKALERDGYDLNVDAWTYVPKPK